MKRRTLLVLALASFVSALAVGADTPTLHVEDIVMHASKVKGVGTVSAAVLVADENGLPVPGATVYAYWIYPNGISNGAPDWETTDADGVAHFVLRAKRMQRGTYTFLIDGVLLEGYAFDRAGSVLGDAIDYP